ncbi:MAG: membrane protein insertion efficiency factor YidD [Candidatus Niyogibacteria bacterium]|nr:membrane protein insertion efficiency factor YidD [Candidatus Niyogibacteria bacterium]
MKYFFIFWVKIYQYVRGILKWPGHCVFYPSCSEYYLLALQKYGVMRGNFLGVRRILRCHPWQDPQIDHLA